MAWITIVYYERRRMHSILHGGYVAISGTYHGFLRYMVRLQGDVFHNFGHFRVMISGTRGP